MTERAGRIYVIYGQGGWITSIGMSQLAKRLAALYPKSTVTTHSWKTPTDIETDIYTLTATMPKILIGYSLGANAVTWIAGSASRRKIDLAVCYDPSVLSTITPPGPNIQRLLLYHNNDFEPEGHALLSGPQVEKTEVSLWHLAICYNEALHQKTLAAVDEVLNPPMVANPFVPPPLPPTRNHP